MVARAADLMGNLRSEDLLTRLQAVKDVKNQVIGNKNRKKTFIKLAAIPRIVEMLRVEEDTGLRVQCAAVVGSLALADGATLTEVSESGAIVPLFKMLTSESDTLVEAGLRALNFIFSAQLEESGPASKFWAQNAPVNSVLASAVVENFAQVLRLLYSTRSSIKTASARLLFHCARVDKQELAKEAIPHLARLAEATGHQALQYALIRALASFLYHLKAETHLQPSLSENLADVLVQSVASHQHMEVRLYSCACFTFGHRHTPAEKAPLDTLKACLGFLLRLYNDEHPHQWRGPYPDCLIVEEQLLVLLQNFPSFKLHAIDGGLIGMLRSRLDGAIERGGCEGEDDMTHLMAIATLLMEDSETARLRLMDNDPENLVELLVECMEHHAEVPSLAIIACNCLRSLLRSAQVSRMTDFGECMHACLALLGSQDPAVQKAACALLCNMLMPFSLAREEAVKLGCIEKLGEMTQSQDKDLAKYSMQALANFLLQANFSDKQRVMDAVRREDPLLDLIRRDPNLCVNVQALHFLQNLTANCKGEEAELVLKWLQLDPAEESDMDFMAEALGAIFGGETAEKDLEHNEVVTASVALLNTVNNISVCSSAVNWLRIYDNSNFLARTPRLLCNTCPEVAVSTLWLLKNLVEGQDIRGGSHYAMLQLFEDNKVSETLRMLESNADVLDVQQRAAEVMDSIRTLEAAVALRQDIARIGV